MAFDFSSLSSFFEHVDSNVEGILRIDTFLYKIDTFSIGFGQAIDWRGQPQHEVQGGRFIITLSQLPEAPIYDWAKRANRGKSGQIVFSTATRGTILDISFEDGHCLSFRQKVDYISGTKVELHISSKIITLNGYSHNNKWTD